MYGVNRLVSKALGLLTEQYLNTWTWVPGLSVCSAALESIFTKTPLRDEQIGFARSKLYNIVGLLQLLF